MSVRRKKTRSRKANDKTTKARTGRYSWPEKELWNAIVTLGREDSRHLWITGHIREVQGHGVCLSPWIQPWYAQFIQRFHREHGGRRFGEADLRNWLTQLKNPDEISEAQNIAKPLCLMDGWNDSEAIEINRSLINGLVLESSLASKVCAVVLPDMALFTGAKAALAFIYKRWHDDNDRRTRFLFHVVDDCITNMDEHKLVVEDRDGRQVLTDDVTFFDLPKKDAEWINADRLDDRLSVGHLLHEDTHA